VNKIYDQDVAMCDKMNVHTLLDLIHRCFPGIFQWTLIVACISGFLYNASANAWKTSLKRANLHTHFRVSFEGWIDKINQHVDTGETIFNSEILFGPATCRVVAQHDC
jgi:hypothetical protein